MTVADLILALKTSDPGRLVVVLDTQSAGLRELLLQDVHEVTLYSRHPDQAPRFDTATEPPGRPVPAVVLGAR